LHFGARTSVWSEFAARSHLIVAAVGSVALLGLAGTAIWLALPSTAYDQVATPAQATPRVEVAAAEPAAPEPAPSAAQPSAAQVSSEKTAAAPHVDTQAVQADVEPTPSQAFALIDGDELEPLDPSDPRWVDGSAVHNPPPTAKSGDKAAATRNSGNPAYTVAAYTSDDASESPLTSAIPTTKPVMTDAGETDEAMLGRPSKTVRSVTMRARPDDNGGVLGTVPGRADVQVVSCAGWCEIIYKGKRGFVFRRFLQNNGQ
jgi:hypothetical protein